MTVVLFSLQLAVRWLSINENHQQSIVPTQALESYESIFMTCTRMHRLQLVTHFILLLMLKGLKQWSCNIVLVRQKLEVQQ